MSYNPYHLDEALAAAIEAKLRRDWPAGLDQDELFIGPVLTPAPGGVWTHVCMEVFVPWPPQETGNNVRRVEDPTVG